MTTHEPRIGYDAFNAMAPAARAALTALGRSVDEANIDKGLLEIIKVRASQLNGCAFCVQFHLNLAHKLGVPRQKLDLVAVWREAGIYDNRERAALAWTDALTLMSAGAPSETAYEDLCASFTEAEVVHLTVAIGTINQWNRIAGGLRFTPPPAQYPG